MIFQKKKIADENEFVLRKILFFSPFCPLKKGMESITSSFLEGEEQKFCRAT